MNHKPPRRGNTIDSPFRKNALGPVEIHRDRVAAAHQHADTLVRRRLVGAAEQGGEGSITGVVLGTILLQVLQNLVNLLGIPSSLNFAVIGGVILIGVLADQQIVRRRQIQQARTQA
ncbi:MAG TPA: hypothetical protein VFT40_06865, partial [Sphingomicrobium sp.]|nr:hypothetical protein [Sphingomicrobium sp.]